MTASRKEVRTSNAAARWSQRVTRETGQSHQAFRILGVAEISGSGGGANKSLAK
jgi:hypothetical protein